MPELSPPIKITSHVLIVGNPIDGVSVWGPFDEWEDASEWAQNNTNDIWCIAGLNHPEA